jgi:pyruvate dehydrogenase E2 component (dihydrolipoamide acetyltransferase)
MPVQLIWGRDDQVVPATHAEALTDRLPVHILPDAGHLPHMEKSAAVNALIRRFVED